jgi:HK97 family phage major capsid protein/HK97 family phage prohead protease
MTVIYKAGTQSASDPYEFVMSSSARDRVGDIVEQDWSLKDFKRNPIALWMHQSSQPIGVWERVRVEGNKLIGRLKLAEKGTSELIDTLRSLVEQRVLRAVSVGFRAGKAEPLDEKNPWEGYRLSENSLFECSLVSIPANSEALSLAKGLSLQARELVFSEKGELKCRLGACEQIQPRDSGRKSLPPISTRNTPMTTLAERIAAKQAELNALRDQLADLTTEVGDHLDDETSLKMEDLTARITASEKDLGTLERAEQSLASGARRISGAGAPAGEPAGRIETRKHREKGHNAFALMTCLAKAHVLHTDPVAIARESYGDDAPEIETLIKTAVAGATTSTSGWASQLVRQTWGEFIDLVRDISIYPRVPGSRLEFDGFGTLNLPRQDGRGGLAGGFVTEGNPIPVKKGTVANVAMTPFKMGVISVFTKELMRRSNPAIEALIRDQMLGDTAETLDTLFLDANARSGRPAGMQDTTEVGSANINAVTNAATGAGGCTVAEILSDTNAALGRVYVVRLGMGGVWLMNPLQRLALESKQEATTGEFTFRDEVQAGRFRGYPIIESANVTSGIVTFVGGPGALAFASEIAPSFETSDQTVLHMEDSPTALSAVASPNTVAAPIQSMFQTDSMAIKMTIGLDWRIKRQAGVQVLTGATGW